MSDIDFKSLSNYAKKFSGFTPKHENLLAQFGPGIISELTGVTDHFYDVLQMIDRAAPFLEGRIDMLKKTHLEWMKKMLTGPYDEAYTAWMYKVGDVHVKVKLPVEFMAGGITLIGNALLPVIIKACDSNTDKIAELTVAVNAVLGFSLMVMEESYQASALAAELENFLAITGMSRSLFDNLASAYK